MSAIRAAVARVLFGSYGVFAIAQLAFAQQVSFHITPLPSGGGVAR